MALRARIAFGIMAAVLVAGLSSCVHHISSPRVVSRAVALDGSEMCIVQECNWTAEPFTTSFVYRRPGGGWGRHYFDHQDWYWGRSRVVIKTNSQIAVFYRGSSPAVTFSWQSETYIMHRWNRTNTGGQWLMPVEWSPGMPVRGR